MQPLFQTIIEHIPAPSGEENAPFKMLVSSAEHNEYVGKLAVGKIGNGVVSVGNQIVLTNYHDADKSVKSKLSAFHLRRVKTRARRKRDRSAT